VYGGDGSVTEIAGALYGTNTPMAIIPGGTANVMAKELGIPMDSLAALELLKTDDFIVRSIDMGLVNGKPFLLRVNLGIMAAMVLDTDAKMKGDLGQLAYGVTALRNIADSKSFAVKMVVDGELIEETGVSLTVTNSGNTGVGDFSLHSGISIDDGYLDILLVRHNDFFTLLKIAGSTLLQSETDAIQHWRCKKVTLTLEEEHAFLCDDCEGAATTLEIKVVPAAIKIIVPPTK
jgi:YegS/Rv2252/BmrU family lipid kinase